MGSTGLPGKVLMTLADEPMLWHIVSRFKAAKRIATVIVATTDDPDDNVIESFCRKKGIPCVRGSKQNVLERYYQAAMAYPNEIIVRIPGDKPLMDPGSVDECVEKLEQGKYDYVSNVHPPSDSDSPFLQGVAVEVFRMTALKTAYREAHLDYEKEHVTPYIWENKNKKFKTLKIALPPLYHKNCRLTVDYPEDFELVKKIYDNLYKEDEIIEIKEVINFLDKNPEIATINARCKQKSYK